MFSCCTFFFRTLRLYPLHTIISRISINTSSFLNAFRLFCYRTNIFSPLPCTQKVLLRRTNHPLKFYKITCTRCNNFYFLLNSYQWKIFFYLHICLNLRINKYSSPLKRIGYFFIYYKTIFNNSKSLEIFLFKQPINYILFFF